MSKLKKLIALMLRRPKEAPIEDILKLYAHRGWILRQGKKHTGVLLGPNGQTQTVPTVSGRMVKEQYIKNMIQDLDLEVYYEEFDNEE
jgi:predicted RNA binding protein YcfA (HicA-like mRNA interferase family)